MVKIFKLLGILSFIFITISCKDNTLEVNVSNIDVSFRITRFEKQFYDANPDQLKALGQKYPFFMNPNVPDSVWLKKQQAESETYLYKRVMEIYTDDALVSELEDLFKHVKYYYPEFEAPEVFTYVSNMDYQKPVIIADGKCFIALDCYLGKEEEAYGGIPEYWHEWMQSEYISRDVAEVLAREVVAKNTSDNSLINHMVYEGKIRQMMQAFLPQVSKQVIMGYSEADWTWCEENEEEMWRFFVENQLLYNTDNRNLPRFIDKAPFSKFYTTADNESPGRVGIWFGWKMVRSYVQYHNKEILPDIMRNTDSQSLFLASKYKPGKE